MRKKTFLSLLFTCFHYRKILKRHIKACFKVDSKQTIKMKGEQVKFKNFERKIKSPFMIYADFESILVPKDNAKQTPDESYTTKYQKHVDTNKYQKHVA